MAINLGQPLPGWVVARHSVVIVQHIPDGDHVGVIGPQQHLLNVQCPPEQRPPQGVLPLQQSTTGTISACRQEHWGSSSSGSSSSSMIDTNICLLWTSALQQNYAAP